MTSILPEAYCQDCKKHMLFIAKDNLKETNEQKITYKCLTCLKVKRVWSDLDSYEILNTVVSDK